jgi:hypothetical protein
MMLRSELNSIALAISRFIGKRRFRGLRGPHQHVLDVDWCINKEQMMMMMMIPPGRLVFYRVSSCEIDIELFVCDPFKVSSESKSKVRFKHPVLIPNIEKFPISRVRWSERARVSKRGEPWMLCL